jgi:hypothetical protein
MQAVRRGIEPAVKGANATVQPGRELVLSRYLEYEPALA